MAKAQAKFTDANYLDGRKAGLSQKEMALQHGVSESMVSKVKKRCEAQVEASTPPIIQAEVMTRQHDALERLGALADQARDLSGLFERALAGDGGARDKLRILAGGYRADILKPYLSLLGELRKLLELDNTIKRTKFDIERVMRFQETVMAVIQEIAPEVAVEIVRRLQALDATVSALDFGLADSSSNT